MEKKVSSLETLLAEFRPTLTEQSGTAQAIDRQAPFKEVACKAIDDGHIEFADQLSRSMEHCLRRSL